MQITTDQHIANLGAMNSREQATAYVRGIKGRDLTELAWAAAVLDPHLDTDLCRMGIVERYVGARLNSAAIQAL